MVLSTCANNKPWSSTVYFICDDNLALYWASIPSRRHSKEIADNPRVSIAVPISMTQPVIGIQAEGTAEVLTDKKIINEVAKIYAKKYSRSSDWANNITNNNTEHKIYRFMPERYDLFDELNYPRNTKLELKI